MLGHPPLDIHRIDRRVHSLHVRSSGERRLAHLSSKVPLELFQPSSLDFTPCLHSITTSHQGTLARSEYPQHLDWIASQDMGPMLTMLALLALRAMLHPSGPRLTRHGTCVN